MEMNTQQIILDEVLSDDEYVHTEQTVFLNTLELLWTITMNIRHLAVVFRKMSAQCTLKEDLETKRMVLTALGVVGKIMKQMRLQKVDLNSPITFDSFLGLLRSDQSYTKFMQLTVNDNFLTMLKDFWSTRGQIKSSIPEKSLSFVCTTTTTTPSTTVRTTIPPVSAPSYVNCEEVSAQIEELYQRTNLASGTGKISSYISRKTADELCTLKREESSGFNVVKLEVIPFKVATKLDKKDWWKHQPLRMLFTTSSNVDPLEMQIQKVHMEVLKRFQADPSLEVETRNYGNSSYYGRQAPF